MLKPMPRCSIAAPLCQVGMRKRIFPSRQVYHTARFSGACIF
jgi:hypothetical protein